MSPLKRWILSERAFQELLYLYSVQAPGHEKQVVERVWFAGVHCNVGGSYRNYVLSDIALKWMVERA